MARGGASGRGPSNARELKSYFRNRAWREHRYAIISVVVVVVAIFSYTIFSSSSPSYKIHYISTNDHSKINEVFKSGDPWTLLCLKSEDNVPKIFESAAKRLHETIAFGVLDCEGKLKSGKSVLTRFGIKSHIQPTIFTVANGEKPKQIWLNDLKKSKDLAARVSKNTEKRLEEIQSSEKLLSKCLQRSSCALILRARKFSGKEKEWLGDLMHSNRKVVFAWMDSTRSELSIESLLPPFVQGVHRMVMFRKNASSSESKKNEYLVSAMSHRGDFDLEDLTEFVAMSDTDKFKALRYVPSLVKKAVADVPEVVPEFPDTPDSRRAERDAARQKAKQERAKKANENKNNEKKSDIEDSYFAEAVNEKQTRTALKHDEEDQGEIIDLDEE